MKELINSNAELVTENERLEQEVTKIQKKHAVLKRRFDAMMIGLTAIERETQTMKENLEVASKTARIRHRGSWIALH